MSSRLQTSLIDFASFEKSKINSLFSLAEQISTETADFKKREGLTGALLFFEASTRTRLSFETACARVGVHPLVMDGSSGTSLEKGETLEDTVLNVAAMQPSFLVIRSGEDLDFNALAKKTSLPILNAGWGKRGHPTQALLDVFTIRKKLGSCENQRLLIVGDVRHSRVAASHFELAKLLNYEIALCGPEGFLPENSAVRVFASLKEGLAWATVAMALRVQLERHDQKYSLAEYRSRYGFTCDNLMALSPQALIMHPGPINQGTELDTEVLADPRAMILEQVKNGVFIRQALIQQILSQGVL
ncbi:Aspartate carbamoyltransferase [compost metagenome]